MILVYTVYVNNCFYFSAEFIIHLTEKNNTFETFKKALLESGAEFTVSKNQKFQF